MRNTLFLLTAPLFLGAILPASGYADAGMDIQWKAVIGADVNKLTADQKSRVEKNLTTLKNTHGCEGTLAACMAQKDRTAQRHAGFVVRAVQKGKEDAYIAKYLALRHVSVHPASLAQIDLSDSPERGPADAPITLVTFECFQCPFCAHLEPKMKGVEAKFKDKIKEYFKFFPVRSHPRGVPSALAALAAHKQGLFWPMQAKMFANRANLDDSDIDNYAKSIGVNLEKFKKDIKDPSLMKAVEKDKLEGMRYGVDGTPTFFINGKRYQASYDIFEIEDRIAEELDIIEGRIPK